MDKADLVHLQQLDAAHHLHPFNDNAALAKKGTRILTRGEGAYVWDANGNKLLDAFARGESPKPGPQINRQMSAPEGGPLTLTEVKD